MSSRETGYVERIADARGAELLGVFGAVSIEGPKWCGKTWTALNHASSVCHVADPAGGFQNRARAELAPADGAFAHSGAGRIARVRMRTMSLAESGDSTGEISLAGVLDGADVRPVASGWDIEELAAVCAPGGWPGALGFSAAQGILQATDYLEAIARSDLVEVDRVRRDPHRMRAFLRSMARNTATAANLATIRRDVAAGSAETVSPNTARDYLTLLRRMFVVEEIPAWAPSVRSVVRQREAPKRILADPSLAVAALGLTPLALIEDLKTFGFVFESLCLRDLLVYGEAMGGHLSHYRDASGLEADAVLTSNPADMERVAAAAGRFLAVHRF
ncbi:MAG: DUF4143 domain-containing protein [Bifidobacteriaceae bacterium]|nr:DUF4143 domain-containing protein [Bifidobacteriaceae bacterium]